MKDRNKIIFWSILLVAIVFCFTNLSLKPPHSDEGGNGFFVNQIWDTGFYAYDPTNYHGPILFYLFQIAEKILGFGIGSFRAVTALFTVLSVWLILRNRDLLGNYASFFSAAALALSPGMAFFGRSAIHEAPFVFSQILLVTGLLRTREGDYRRGIISSFTGLLGCILLKETFVIFLFSLGVAWVLSDFLNKPSSASPKQKLRRKSGTKAGAKQVSKGEPKGGRKVISPQSPPDSRIDKVLLLKLLLVCFIVWLLFYTGFFHHRQGAREFFLALMPWLKTGIGGAGHEKPFTYWLSLFGRYEWAAALGLIGAFAGIAGGSWKMRFFSVLGIVNLLVYSFISYKTPWCVITILWPLVVTAGLWVEIVFSQKRGMPVYWLTWCAVGAVAVQSAAASVRLNFIHYTDPSEPYVYVQTKNDIKDVEGIIKKKIASTAAAHNMRIQVNINDSWPLPWLFSRFPNTGYGDTRIAFQEKADVIFAEINHEDADTEGLYLGRQIELREARGPIMVYLRKAYFQGIDLPGFGPSERPADKRG